MSKLPSTKPSLGALDGDDVVEVQAHWKRRYPDATPIQLAQLTESSLARLDAKGLRGAFGELTATVHNVVIPRIEVLEQRLAPTRARMPSIGEATDARDLARLDAQVGAPPSLDDRTTRLEDSQLRTRKIAARSPVVSAALISLALALADVLKAYLLHR